MVATVVVEANRKRKKMPNTDVPSPFPSFPFPPKAVLMDGGHSGGGNKQKKQEKMPNTDVPSPFPRLPLACTIDVSVQ
jgi:hypothetical protein